MPFFKETLTKTTLAATFVPHSSTEKQAASHSPWKNMPFFRRTSTRSLPKSILSVRHGVKHNTAEIVDQSVSSFTWSFIYQSLLEN